MQTITINDFLKVDLRIGTIIKAEDFKEARNPSYKIWADFGPEIGVKKTSAQITRLYKLEELTGKQILGVVNLKPKQIANFISEFLLTGFANQDQQIVLAQPQQPVPNGARLI
jgi:tRNA-binding protein